MILFLLFGFSLSSQNNLITNSSFDTGISDYAGINGASDEWFTINGDPNIAQTAETIHLNLIIGKCHHTLQAGPNQVYCR